ncbi:unnamed protein product, partial [Brassica rapa subsp. narinosa]
AVAGDRTRVTRVTGGNTYHYTTTTLVAKFYLINLYLMTWNLEIYCYFIVLLFLVDQKKYNEHCSSQELKQNVIASRLYFYYSLSYEQTGDLADIRGNLLALHHSATLRHDELGQAVRALRFPPNTHKEKESDEKRRERKQQEEELAKHMAEEDDDDF